MKGIKAELGVDDNPYTKLTKKYGKDWLKPIRDDTN